MLRQALEGNAYIHPGRAANWDSSEHYRPERVHRPGYVDKLIDIVKRCSRSGRKLFPIGSLHSWSFLEIRPSLDPGNLFLREPDKLAFK